MFALTIVLLMDCHVLFSSAYIFSEELCIFQEALLGRAKLLTITRNIPDYAHSEVSLVASYILEALFRSAVYISYFTQAHRIFGSAVSGPSNFL